MVGSSNGTNNGGTAAAAVSETSPLMMTSTSNREVGDGVGGDTGTPRSDVNSEASDDTVQSMRLWDELNKPWPSTYERSIALLSSPNIRPEQANLFTKSPKPGSTPLALARRRDMRLQSYTPEGLLPPIRQGSHGTTLSDRDSFRQDMEKVKSLDFASKTASKGQQQFMKIQKEQERKAVEARKYRAKILQQKDEEAALMSPGYQREKSMRTPPRKSMRNQEAEAAMMMDGKSTVAQCIFNLANILMGVGLLALPYALKSAGWFGGLFSLFVFGLITWRTSILIGRELNGDPRPSHCFVDSPFKSPLPPGSTPEARMYPPIHSFPDIARASFGEGGCIVLSAILYFELFSCICIFLVTMGDHLHQLFPGITAATHILIVGIVSIAPAVVLRTPALLSYLSMVGTVATIAVVLSVVASAFVEGDISDKVANKFHLENSAPYHIWWDTSGIALAFGLVAYCFSGHAIVPSIYSSMQKPQEFEKMVTVTFSIVICACLGVGVAGYYIFGSTALDQITLSLERSSKAGAAMKALTWLMILTGEPFVACISHSSG